MNPHWSGWYLCHLFFPEFDDSKHWCSWMLGDKFLWSVPPPVWRWNPFSFNCEAESSVPFLFRLWSSLAHPSVRGAPRATTFPPVCAFRQLPRRLVHGPYTRPQHLFSVHDHGRLRSAIQCWDRYTLSIRRPDSRLSRLVAFSGEENERPVTQSIATPNQSSRTISTHGSRRSCPGWAAAHLTWMLTVFTSVACYLDAFQDKWGLSSPYHVATTYPCGQPGLPSVRLTGGTCHADWTVPRQDVYSLPLRVPPPRQKCFHTRKFGTLEGPPPHVGDMPWGTHLPSRLSGRRLSSVLARISACSEFEIHCSEFPFFVSQRFPNASWKRTLIQLLIPQAGSTRIDRRGLLCAQEVPWHQIHRSRFRHR